MLAQALVALLNIMQLLILARVLMSWIDRNPYSDNALKRTLAMLTDPLLEPLRRVIPPVGGALDVSPIVAIVILSVLQQVVLELFSY